MSGDPFNPCGRVFYDFQGRQRAVGEPARGQASAGVYQGAMPTPSKDVKLKRPKRPCSRCGVKFQPTIKRRMLCATCYGWAGHNDSPYEPDGESEGVPL